MASNFNIGNDRYLFLHQDLDVKRKFGLAISYWHTNLEDLMFALRQIARWPGREMIAVSVCSHASPGQYLAELTELAEFVVHCERDAGHQDGTTLQCNGAVAPIITRTKAKTVLHTDADAILLSPAYFFGWSSLVLETGKALLTSQNSFICEQGKLVGHPELGPGSVTDSQFGSMFVLNVEQALLRDYWPFIPKGNFETDRYWQFAESGLDVTKDAIILPRVETPSGPLKNMDFSLGVMHSTNARDPDEVEDRKVRMARLLSIPTEKV